MTTATLPRNNSKRRRFLTAAERAEEEALRAIERARAAQPRVSARFPRKLAFLDRPARYKVAHGGRGGAKSWNFARKLILIAYAAPTRILCARELQVSIGDSVHKLLKDQIESLGLTAFFDVTANSIKTVHHAERQSEFIFAGIRNNTTKIKSMEGVDICWVEEAEKVSARSWEVLIPTIRKPGSEIWISFNPADETDPTYQRFVVTPPDDAVVVQINWRDNPWFPEPLRKEMEYLRRVDYDAYLHVWEGHTRNQSDAQVLRGKVESYAFEPHAEGTGEWFGPYYGADWGFSQDPSTLVKCWVNGTRLFIEYEAYGVGVDVDDTPDLFRKVPGAEAPAGGRASIIRADCSRPETISFMQRHGFPGVVGVEKWAGSVEDGVSFLRSFERIVIHPRCVNALTEARLWSYKVDKLTSAVLRELVDKHNHIWDAVRYAIQPMIRQGSGMGLLAFLKSNGAVDDKGRPAGIGGAGRVAPKVEHASGSVESQQPQQPPPEPPAPTPVAPAMVGMPGVPVQPTAAPASAEKSPADPSKPWTFAALRRAQGGH